MCHQNYQPFTSRFECSSLDRRRFFSTLDFGHDTASSPQGGITSFLFGGLRGEKQSIIVQWFKHLPAREKVEGSSPMHVVNANLGLIAISTRDMATSNQRELESNRAVRAAPVATGYSEMSLFTQIYVIQERDDSESDRDRRGQEHELDDDRGHALDFSSGDTVQPSYKFSLVSSGDLNWDGLRAAV